MISIVIPALNEAKYIGNLLESVFAQDIEEEIEIVVADADSTDGTLAIVTSYQQKHPRIKITKGGLPAVARNNGARASSGGIIVFIDSDITLPTSSTLRECVAFFREQKLAVAAARLTPNSNRLADHILVGSYNRIFMPLAKHFRPLGAMCILVRRDVFERAGGYPEDCVMSEDHDFVYNCTKYGPYDILPKPVSFSVRRLEKEGRFGIAWKYTYASIYRIAVGPITKPIFKYEFSYTDSESV